MSALATPAHGASYIQLSGGALTAGETEISLEMTGASPLSDAEDLDGGMIASAVFGEDYEALGKNTFSLEGEALYLSSDIEGDATSTFGADASVDMWGLMANAKYNFHITDMLAPYIGAGAGYANANYSIAGDDEEDWGVAWQLLAGAVVNVTSNASFDIGYRYVELPEFSYTVTPVTLSAETNAQAVTAGFRFRF
jgi:opacity protein-like surface antigen